MGPEEFRAAGHELIDWIADYRARIPQLPVQAQVGPGEVAGKLQRHAPEEAEAFRQVLAVRGNLLGLGSVWGSGLSGCEEAKMRYGS